MYAAYRDFGYFAHAPQHQSTLSSSANFLDREFEEGSCDNVLDFFAMLGKAKVDNRINGNKDYHVFHVPTGRSSNKIEKIRNVCTI